MTGRLIVEADGGSRGNPGPAGYGAVVRDAATGTVLTERNAGLGVTTNNVAEYEGLIAGLTAAVELGATEVDVRMDSKLVVEQMSGRWRVKHDNLKPLAAKAADLARTLGTVRFSWIPRERNKHADRLANEAMDTAAGIPRPSRPAEPAARPAQPAQQDQSTQQAQPTAWTGASGQPTRLLLLRHGQTALSVDRRYSGRGDVDLTDLGRQQAQAAGKRLAGMPGVVTPEGAAPIVASPLRRARSTAQAVAEATGGAATVHDGLVETDFGDWEGLTFRETAERYPELHRRWLADPSVDPPNGESLHSVFERVRDLRDELVREYQGRTLILVSHVTPIKALLRLGLDAGPSIFYHLHLDLASLSIVEFYADGKSSVRLVNDTSYLV